MLCRIIINWWGRGATLFKNVVEGYAGMVIRKNRNVFCCRNNNNLLSFLFSKKYIFVLRQLEPFYRSFSYNQMHPL